MSLKRYIPYAVALILTSPTMATSKYAEEMPDHIENRGFTFQGFGLRFGKVNVDENELEKVDQINRAYTFVADTLIKDRAVEPKRILAIFDVDGTLLKEPYPTPGDIHELREGAMETLTALQKLGVQIIASSAWSNPQDTYKRLIQAGFKEILQLNNEPSFEQDPLTKFFISKTGLIASVKDMRLDARYFRQKAYAPAYLFSDKKDDFTHVLFIDDSLCNFQFFYKDVLRKKHSPYKPGTDFTYFLLTQQRS